MVPHFAIGVRPASETTKNTPPVGLPCSKERISIDVLATSRVVITGENCCVVVLTRRIRFAADRTLILHDNAIAAKIGHRGSADSPASIFPRKETLRERNSSAVAIGELQKRHSRIVMPAHIVMGAF